MMRIYTETMTADNVYTRGSDQQTDVDDDVNGGDDVTVVFPLKGRTAYLYHVSHRGNAYNT
jgi:hypothetical protein